MNWQELIHHYGYFAIMVGTFFEGETILFIAAALAHQGYLGLPGTMIAAFLGAVAGDQLYYYIGYRKGMKFIRKREKWQKKTERIFKLLQNHQNWLILGFRFLYGIRTLTPFVLGAAGILPRRYVPLNMLGAAIWAVTISLLGYWFGETVKLFLVQLHHFEGFGIIAGLFIIAIICFIFYKKRKTYNL